MADFERRAEDDRLIYNKFEKSLIFLKNSCRRQNRHWSYKYYMQQDQMVHGQKVQSELNFKGPLDLIFIRANTDGFLNSAIQACSEIRKESVIIFIATHQGLYQNYLQKTQATPKSFQVVNFADQLKGLIFFQG